MVSQLLQPKYSQYFTSERRQEIRTLVQEAVDLLGAPEVVVDDKHGPKLFSRFLAGLLATQSVNPNTLSPSSSKSMQLRRTGSRSKAASGKGKDPDGSSSSSPLHSYGAGPELLSPLTITEFPSPAQQSSSFGGNSRGQSPFIGLGLQTADVFQGASMLVDQDLLDSMQFLSDPVWQDTSVPGELLLSTPWLLFRRAFRAFYQGYGLISCSRFPLDQPVEHWQQLGAAYQRLRIVRATTVRRVVLELLPPHCISTTSCPLHM